MNSKRILSLVLTVVMLMSIFIIGTTAEEASPYRDVKASRWSFADIMYVTEKGLMNGTTADKFAPAETMTRGMVVTVLYRMEGSPSVEYKNTFSDVKSGKWFTDAVIWASGKQIVNGMGDGKFGIGEKIIRTDMVVLAARLARKLGKNVEKKEAAAVFADYAIIPHYAYEDVVAFQQADLINGDENKNFNPAENTTRAEAAVFFWNIFSTIK